MKKLLIALTALSTLTIASPAFAKTLFDCTTTNGKQILLTEKGNALNYRFGKKGKPELTFSVSKDEAIYAPWNGIGRYMNYSLDLPNGNVVYSVFRSADKHSSKVESGVMVHLQDGKTSKVLCRQNQIKADELESIDGVAEL